MSVTFSHFLVIFIIYRLLVQLLAQAVERIDLAERVVDDTRRLVL